MAATVGEVLRQSAAALGLKERELLEALVRFVQPQVGGDSDPGRETLLSYEKSPRTRCGYKFAGMVLDLLQSRQSEIASPEDFQRARRACLSTLSENRKPRYVVPPRTNAASLRRIEDIRGPYVLIRRSPSDQTMRSEFLFLDQRGRGDTQTFATCVFPELVSRGTWSVIQQNACCTMHGFRGNYDRRDILNLNFLYEEPDTGSPLIMSGLMYGITSLGLRPVVLPTIAVRASARLSSNDFRKITDGSDTELRAGWSMATREKHKMVDRIGQILDAAFVPTSGAIVVHDGNIVSKVLKSCRGIGELCDKTIGEFHHILASERP